jgi:CRP-like cAMP-binding protein
LRCIKLGPWKLKNADESLLAGIPPFRKLDRSQIREILDLASPQRFDAARQVFREGAEANRFYLLLDGHIRVIRTTANGEQVIVMHIASGQLFGIAVALGHANYPATAMTADECLTLSWPNRLWEQFATEYDGFSTETYKIVGERIGEMQNRVMEMATQQVEQRVASALLRMINQTGQKVENGIEIDFPITRQDISEMTGTTLHTVSRLLSAWGKDGIVASKRRKIVVTQPQKIALLSAE